MEFILINENKIKVMLSETDMEEFEIDADELDYSNTDTKRMFWDILSKAKHSTGFDTDGQKVLVQFYPSRHGGCEMFVTKIGFPEGYEECRDNTDVEAVNNERITLRPRAERKRSSRKAFAAFSFETLFDMLTVCSRLKMLDYSGESSAYIGDNSVFYLFLSDVEQSGYYAIDRYSFINEFGRSEDHESTGTYLGEHGRSVCKSDAVKQLADLA